MTIREAIAEKARGLGALSLDEEGQDMTEYALLAAFISPVVILAIVLIGPELNRYFQDVVGALAR